MTSTLSSYTDINTTVGNAEFYVLGDNLDSSKDSRFADVGNIKRSDIVGKVWFVLR